METETVKDHNLLVPAKAAAKELKVHYNTLLRRIERGKIKALRLGWSLYIHREELDRALIAYRVN